MTSRTFRLFVSSTFTDFADERQALHDRVWPQARALAQELGARFVPIDLRWGIPAHARGAHATVAICLAELRRCQELSPRPAALALLGQRYGWRPPPARLPQDLMQRLRDAGNDPALACYRLDGNSLPPDYRLLPAGQWPTEGGERLDEGRLISGLYALVQRAGLGQDEHFASITEREVTTALQEPSGVIVRMRTITDVDRLPDPWRYSVEGAALNVPGGYERQQELRAFVRTQARDFAEFEVARSSEGEWQAYLEAMCASVLASLTESMQQAVHDWSTSGPGRFVGTPVEYRPQPSAVLGRESILKVLAQPGGTGRSRLTVLHAEPGAGKSAVLGELLARSGQGAPVIAAFVGAATGSTSLDAVLAILIQGIRGMLGEEADAAPPGDLAGWIDLAAGRMQFTVIIDALDQLSADDRAHEYAWLPSTAPAGCRIIVSTAAGAPLGRLRQAHPDADFIALGPIDDEFVPAVIGGNLARVHRQVTPTQQHAIEGSSRPTGLWLHLASQMAARLSSDDPPPLLPSTSDGILNALVTGWQRDHGEALVQVALGCIAASRDGLTEDEIEVAIGQDPAVRSEFAERSHQPWPTSEDRLPSIIWARLRADLDPYLAVRDRGGLAAIRFFHHSVAALVRERFLNPVGDADLRLHRLLTGVFQGLLDGAADPAARLRAEHERDWHAQRARVNVHWQPLDPEASLLLLYRQADQGNAEAMFRISSREQERDVSRYWLELSAASGYPPAMVNLGQALEGADEVMARAWYARAAALGDPHAVVNLARLTPANPSALGNRVDQSDLCSRAAIALAEGRLIEARRLWERAASEGSAEAHARLGDLAAAAGEEDQAREHWNQAAEGGHLEAMERLAQDALVQGNLDVARRMLEAAASGGHVGAMTDLGDLLIEEGDEIGAQQWWLRARDRGDARAASRLDEQRDAHDEPRTALQ